MQNWQYDHTKFIQKVDQFANQIADDAFSQTWTYTKKMISAHALAMCPESMNEEEALSLAWSQFESTFDEQDDAILALAGIVIHLVNSVPLGKTLAFHDTIEIGFAMARGFSEEEAMLEQKALIQQMNAFVNTTTRTCPLSVIVGGKN